MSSAALLVDGLIILLYFGVIAYVGLSLGKRDKSLEEYALGGRRVPWWAVMASIIAAETSAATFIGAPAEGFATRGLTYIQLTLGLILGRVLVGHIFLKPYFTYKVYTVYDFLAIRFGPLSKNYVSALFLVMRVLASGVRLFVPSLVMVLAWRMLAQGEQVSFQQLESWTPYAWAIVILTAITCAYTLLGGIKAVIWTDVIQATLMFGSALLAIVTILLDIGNGDLIEAFAVLGREVPEMTRSEGYLRTGFENLPADADLWATIRHVLESKYTLPAALIAVTMLNMAAFGTDQDMVQRILTAPNYRKGRQSLITAALMDVPIAAAFTFIGVLLIAYYAQHPERRPTLDNHVFGAYILSEMPIGVRGLVLAGVFATAMGSLSAALNALATTATNDWYIPYFARSRGERHHVTAARVFTFIFALLMVMIAITFAILNVKYPTMTIIPIALGIASYILGPMLGVFMIGMFTRTRGSDLGNIIAVTFGLIAIFVLSGRFFDLLDAVAPAATVWHPEWLPRIEFTWYAMIGALATFGVGLLFPTPASMIESARARALAAQQEASLPPAVRSH